MKKCVISIIIPWIMRRAAEMGKYLQMYLNGGMDIVSQGSLF